MQICLRSVSLIAGLLSTLGGLLFIADRLCTGAGGQTSDNAWTCTLGAAGGEVVSLWSLIDLSMVAIAVLLVGVPVFLAIRRIGRRWDSCATGRSPAPK